MRELHQNFGVAAKVIQVPEKCFLKEMLKLIFHETSRGDTEAQEKALAAKFCTKETLREKRE